MDDFPICVGQIQDEGWNGDSLLAAFAVNDGNTKAEVVHDGGSKRKGFCARRGAKGIGGGGRNRTGVHGFAGRCITTLPPRRAASLSAAPHWKSYAAARSDDPKING
jgi:hypothetical protein